MEERDRSITVRLTKEEDEAIKCKAKAAGMNVSEYVRNIASKGITAVGYDPQMTNAVSALHEDARLIASELQKTASITKGQPDRMVSIRLCTAQLLELNKKLRVIIEGLKQTQEKEE